MTPRLYYWFGKLRRWVAIAPPNTEDYGVIYNQPENQRIILQTLGVCTAWVKR